MKLESGGLLSRGWFSTGESRTDNEKQVWLKRQQIGLVGVHSLSSDTSTFFDWLLFFFALFYFIGSIFDFLFYFYINVCYIYSCIRDMVSNGIWGGDTSHCNLSKIHSSKFGFSCWRLNFNTRSLDTVIVAKIFLFF